MRIEGWSFALSGLSTYAVYAAVCMQDAGGKGWNAGYLQHKEEREKWVCFWIAAQSLARRGTKEQVTASKTGAQ